MQYAMSAKVIVIFKSIFAALREPLNSVTPQYNNVNKIADITIFL